MGRRTLITYFLTLCIIALPFRLYADPTTTDADTTSESQTQPESNTRGTLIKTSGLCVGGALLGSFIPVLGSLVGCAIGGLSGWYISRKKQTEVASSARPTVQPAPGAMPVDATVDSGE